MPRFDLPPVYDENTQTWKHKQTELDLARDELNIQELKRALKQGVPPKIYNRCIRESGIEVVRFPDGTIRYFDAFEGNEIKADRSTFFGRLKAWYYGLQ